QMARGGGFIGSSQVSNAAIELSLLYRRPDAKPPQWRWIRRAAPRDGASTSRSVPSFPDESSQTPRSGPPSQTQRTRPASSEDQLFPIVHPASGPPIDHHRL